MILYLGELFKKLDLTTLSTLCWDFDKAFDNVCHEKVIEKLRTMEIAGGALTVLENYLKERYQKYMLHRIYHITGIEWNSWTSILQSVYQRSPRNSNEQMLRYPDDYKVDGTYPVTLQIEASRIWQFFSKNMMKLHLEKCKLLSITVEANVQLGGIFLEKPEVEKDLEIAVSWDFFWTN